MSIQQIVPFNFNDLYNEIEKEFNLRGYDTAQGSNTSQLATILAYTASMLNANTALNVSETILPYAEQRKSIVNIARNLGYEIKHKTSYVYNLTLELEVGKFVIPKYTEFKINNKTYYYLGRQIEYNNLEEGGTIQLQVKEGTMHKYEDEPESLYITTGEVLDNGVRVPQYYIDIPYINIEENGLEVYCSYFDDYGVFFEKEQWEKSPDTYIEVDSTLTKQFIRIDNIEYGTPRIYFKYAGIGSGLKVGTEVFINALETSGVDGKIEDIYDVDAVEFNIAKCKVQKIELVSEGTDEEENSSIKENAPKLFNSANRMIVANDYIAFCNRDTRVRNSMVWGGEDEFPKSPGHIWFTFIPEVERSFTSDEYKLFFKRDNIDFDWDYSINDEQQKIKRDTFYEANYIKGTIIRSNEKDSSGNILNPGIWDNLDSLKVPTLVYHNRHPIFCLFSFQVEIVKYLVAENKQVTHQEIFDIIDNFFKGDDSVKMEDFEKEYFDSSLIKRIDKRITDISGLNLYTDTKLLLNEKTVVLENPEVEYRDIYIPLALPFEKYFTDDGYLMIERLPNIDTENFISYNENLADLYVDWSAIQQDIDQKRVKQKQQKLIVAPVKAKFKCTYNFGDHPGVKKAISKFCIYPDSFQQTESTDFTFNNTVLTLIKKDGSSQILEYNSESGWYYNAEKSYLIDFGPLLEISDDDTLEIQTTSFCGFYYLFNAYTKEILVHLFVDGTTSGYEISLAEDWSKNPNGDKYASYLYSYDDYYLHSNNDFYMYTEAQLTEDSSYVDTVYTTPRSYLTTSDNMYLYTTDSYYLTTNGYALSSEDEENSYTGPIVKEINKWMYLRSGLKLDLFNANRLLNLKYLTYNFRTIRNVIPYLKQVEFLNIVD